MKSNREAQKLYDERVKKYEAESQDLTALEKHVFLFLDKNKTFSPASTAEVLTLMRSHMATIKGGVISAFNASHGSSCPALSAMFVKDQNGYARFLHLGTTRIWKEDGTIDEARLQALKDYVIKDQENNPQIMITRAKLQTYLNNCLRNDPEITTNNNGRNASTLFSNRNLQAGAAVKGWDEVFDRLCCGYTDQGDAYITWEIAEEFFRDSPKAFLRAECGLLPVEKPEVKHVAQLH